MAAAKAAARAEAEAAELKRKGNMIMREDLAVIMNVGRRQDPKWAKAVAITCIDFVEWTAKLQEIIIGNKFKTHAFEPLEEVEKNEPMEWRKYLHGVVAFMLEGRAFEKCDFLFHQYIDKFQEHRHDGTILAEKQKVSSLGTEIEKLKKRLKNVRREMKNYLEFDPTDSEGKRESNFDPEITGMLASIEKRKLEREQAVEGLRATIVLATENRYLSRKEALEVIRIHNAIEKHSEVTPDKLVARAEERLDEGGYGDVLVDEAQAALHGAEAKVMGLVPKLEAARERAILAKEALSADFDKVNSIADDLQDNLSAAEAELATKARLLSEAKHLSGFLTLEQFTRLVCDDDFLKDHFQINFHQLWGDLESQMKKEKKEALRRPLPKSMKRGLFH